MHVLTLKHVHVASTQGHFRKEAKRDELAFLLSNDDKIKCVTADRKTVFILLFSRSGMFVQFRTAFGVLPYHIPVVGIHSLGLEIEIISFLLFTHGVRISLRQSLLRRKNCKGVGYGTDLLEFFIFKSCGLLKTADLAVETRILESILARVTREPTRPLTEYNPDLNKHKRFVIKKKICHEQKVLSQEKKFMDKKL